MTRLSDFYFEKDSVYELVRDFSKSTFEGGNHNRTLLMTHFAEQLGVTQYQVAPYARVIELVHNATLIHDDVIDLAPERRGCKTLNSQLENRKCILVGDYMLAKAMSELTSFASKDIVMQLAHTLKDLVDGEILQSFANEKFRWSIDDYEKIAIKKTGSILRWCFITPLLMKDVTQKEILTKVEKVAHKLGLIYQMVDDIKDFSTLSKKTPFLDIKNWNINVVLLSLQEKNPHLFEILYLQRNISSLSQDQRRSINNSIKDILFQIDQLADDIKKILNNDLQFTDFAIFIEEFIFTQFIQMQKRMLDYDFEIDDKVI